MPAHQGLSAVYVTIRDKKTKRRLGCLILHTLPLFETEDTPRRSPKREQMRLTTSGCLNSCSFRLAAVAGDAQLAGVCEPVPDTLPPSCTCRVDKSAH